MSKVYKRFIVLILLVVVISGVVIYTTVDINTLKNLNRFQPWSIGLAVLAVGLGMFFDGSRLMHMVKISNEKISLYQAVQVVFGNYFLALLTPGATGGAVAQLMFLRHAGVPTGKATVLVIVRTLLS
ncbi:MAG: flippase-like domain-containing protein, partial [Selenomonas sp.]|nr:flippase-like domain-containing protein [Selenomonas sp.]